MKVYVGTSGYSYKEWKGKFYPEKISPREMLRSYSERLSTVEINNTFYHMPTESVLQSWAQRVGSRFVFAVKAPQLFTHIKQLRDVGRDAEYFFTALVALEKKLGPVLFQFPASFHADRPTLESFLGLIPRDVACAFEFRSPSWMNSEILELLRKKKHCLCTADSEERPADQIVATASWGYLRLRRLDYSDRDLAAWLSRIRAEKWRRAFVYFKHEEGGVAPALALKFAAMAER